MLRILAALALVGVFIGSSIFFAYSGPDTDFDPWSIKPAHSQGIETQEELVADAAELKFRQDIIDLALPYIEQIAKNSNLVSAVQRANHENTLSHREILEIDKRWRGTQGEKDPLVQKYLNNTLANYLRDAQKTHLDCLEIFVMDNKGCLVGESNKTSDYWQGDEDKWKKSYNGGEGQVHAGNLEFDESTHAYVIQVSVPVNDRSGRTIGAMTISLSADGK